ncbi:MAG: outer membrane lipoprotein-sorting protein [Magnetococcales bacterium]|nr:outer membrane lipoprotein-sorting protein [Magnetococcales bacterium]
MVGLLVWSWWSAGWAMDATEILQTMDRKMHAASYESFNRITFELPNGRQRVVTLYSAKASGRRALLVVVAPDELRGRAVLKVGDEVWMHMPGELETRKSNPMLSVVGGVFNNADYLIGDFSEEYQATLVSEEPTHWNLSLKPLFPIVPYARLELKVDKTSLMPLELTQFDAGGFALKTIHYKDAQPASGDHLVPMLLETFSGLNAAYRSSWRVGRMESREFPANAFTREFLPQAGRLMK